MTGGPFSEVDLDLLADYVGGALDGTPEEAELARLIDEDPAWADAYATLTAGIDAVRLDLAGWATEPISMPPVVAERLVSAITRASLPGDTGPAVPGSPAGSTDTSTDRADLASTDLASTNLAEPDPDASGHLVRRPRRSGVPVQAGGGAAPPHGTRGPGRRRQWVRRMAGPILIATVVAGFAGFAVSRLVTGGGAEDTAAGTALSSADNGAEQPQTLGSGPPRAVTEPSAERVLTTGTDYTPSSLPDTASALTKQNTPSDRAGVPDRLTQTPTTVMGGAATATPARSVSGLERLADRTVLAACLDAVAAAHAQGPIAVELVDYATFQGTAALVVVFTDQSGARWAWATGPNCGTSASGADVTYQTRVG
ncbi:hypothetical protein ACFP2T_23260 [Plantactinospora solaniradicis]|uniref:Zinc-finger domain-containing protein n=1 Tax=Plantactinospora solaniradicis TaxID=1723736 RepID=A0ABW1KCW2_9ACTN